MSDVQSRQSEDRNIWLASGPHGEANGSGARSEPVREPFLPRLQHLQAPSDIAGSGGAPRLATAWETEARSVPMVFARSVNTEGPRT